MMTMMTKGSPTLAPAAVLMFIEKVNSLLATAWRLILLRGPGLYRHEYDIQHDGIVGIQNQIAAS